MIAAYGPASYYDLGRVAPRDALRVPYGRARSRLTIAVYPVIPPSTAVLGPYCFSPVTANTASLAASAQTGEQTTAAYRGTFAVKAGCDCDC